MERVSLSEDQVAHSSDYAEDADVRIMQICTTASCQMPCHSILEHQILIFFLQTLLQAHTPRTLESMPSDQNCSKLSHNQREYMYYKKRFFEKAAHERQQIIFMQENTMFSCKRSLATSLAIIKLSLSILMRCSELHVSTQQIDKMS